MNYNHTSEYVASFTNNNAIPNHGFEVISYELKFLKIEDSFLEQVSFKKIAAITDTAIQLLRLFKEISRLLSILYIKNQPKLNNVNIF